MLFKYLILDLGLHDPCQADTSDQELAFEFIETICCLESQSCLLFCLKFNKTAAFIKVGDTFCSDQVKRTISSSKVQKITESCHIERKSCPDLFPWLRDASFQQIVSFHQLQHLIAQLLASNPTEVSCYWSLLWLLIFTSSSSFLFVITISSAFNSS